MKKPPDGGPIWSAWSSGGYLGGRKARPHGRVTVQPDYYLNTSDKAGLFPWTPVRWWQKASNTQVEVEVPSVQRIDISRSIDSDADTCKITISNTVVDAFGWGPTDSPDFGQPGALTPDRGTVQPNPWNYGENYWKGVLGVNACLRTYQGWGGTDKTIEQAIADGNLVLTGVWLVDDPDFSNSSSAGPVITLNCRSMAKLLIDQEVYPPLVPPQLYPVSFYSDNVDVGAVDPVEIYGHTTGGFPPAGTGKYIVDIEGNHTSNGYWLAGTDGGVFAYGATHYFGNPVGTLVSGDYVVGMAVTGDDNGYWIATAGGRVYCQPEGTMVTTVIRPDHGTYSAYTRGCRCELCRTSASDYNSAYKQRKAAGTHLAKGPKYRYHAMAIEDLSVGDWVVSYNMENGCLNRSGRRISGVIRRPYSGRLVTITTGSGSTSRYTPEHLCVALMGDCFADKYVVYMMRKQGSYRIGKTTGQMTSQNRRAGLAIRAQDEGADAAWVLSLHDSESEALLAEALTAYEYNIPTRVFYSQFPENGVDPAAFWAKVGDNSTRAAECLSAYGRDIRFPFWVAGAAGRFFGAPTCFQACNLLTGMRVLPADNVRWNGRRTTLSSEDGEMIVVGDTYYEGTVVSLEVEDHHTYVADGIVTHNCYGNATYGGGVASPVDPIIAIERMGDGTGGSPNHSGYIAVDNVGHVYAFGGAPFLGGDPGGASTMVGAACRPQGDGYWLTDNRGEVYAYGGAHYFGGAPGGLAKPITGIASTPSGNGYYLTGADGGVFTFGDAIFVGSVPSTFISSATFDNAQMAQNTDILELDPSGAPALASDVGHPISLTDFSPTVTPPSGITVLAFIDNFHVQISWTSPEQLYPIIATVQRSPTALTLNDPVCAIAPATNGDGYWLGAQDGGVFTYSEIIRNQYGQNVYGVRFYGSLPGAFTYFLPGNYADFTDIVAYWLLWSGWNLYDGGLTDTVYGNLQTTGTHSTSMLGADLFDKKPVIDAIKVIGNIVGRTLRIGDEGEAHFEDPNTWESGNVLPDGTRVQVFPVIDEKTQLIDYQRSDPDKDLRSQIIVASEDPHPPGPGGSPPIPGTITSAFTPPQAALLKGMVKPAAWFNEVFTSQAEQEIMAQLIAIQIYYKTHIGSLTMLANPMLDVDDQVQILERAAFELNYHYVRGIDTTMDLASGDYTAKLTTNILSPTVPWSITKPFTPGTTTIARVIADGSNTTSA